MSIQIYKSVDSDQIMIMHGGEVLHINDQQTLIELQEAISQCLRTNTRITTKQARTIAKEQGTDLHNSILLYACQTGKIANAQKNGQWRFPKQAFLDWLELYKLENQL